MSDTDYSKVAQPPAGRVMYHISVGPSAKRQQGKPSAATTQCTCCAASTLLAGVILPRSCNMAGWQGEWMLGWLGSSWQGTPGLWQEPPYPQQCQQPSPLLVSLQLHTPAQTGSGLATDMGWHTYTVRCLHEEKMLSSMSVMLYSAVCGWLCCWHAARPQKDVCGRSKESETQSTLHAPRQPNVLTRLFLHNGLHRSLYT